MSLWGTCPFNLALCLPSGLTTHLSTLPREPRRQDYKLTHPVSQFLALCVTHRYNNSAYADSSVAKTLSFYNHSSTTSFRFPDSLPPQLQPNPATPSSNTTAFSFQLHGHIRIPTTGGYTFNCTVSAVSGLTAYMWVNDHLMCPNDANNANVTLPLTINSLAHIRVEVIQPPGWLPSNQPQLELLWALNGSAWSVIPSSVLVACLTDARLYQLQIKQHQLALGWETLNAYDLLSHTLLPHSLSLTLSLYQLSTRQYRQGWYVERAINGSDTLQQVRIGNRTWTGEQDHPYTSLHARFNNLNISVESTTNRTGNTLNLLIQGTDTSTNYSDYRLILTTSYLWNRAGQCGWLPANSSADNGVGAYEVVQCVSAGIDDRVSVYSSAMVSERDLPGVNKTIYGEFVSYAFPTDSQPIITFQALTRTSNEHPQTITQIKQTIQYAARLPFDRSPHTATAAAAAAATIGAPPFPAEQYNCVQTSLAWLSLYTPFEGIITVVSRRPSWDFGFGYTLFEWDSFIAVYMIASFQNSYAARQLAQATFIQIVKSKVMTPSGFTFTPNYATGTIASRDRTEPPLAAKVLDEMVRMWSTSGGSGFSESAEAQDEVVRLTALVYDDLVSEVEWFHLRRRTGSAQLITLGSDPNTPIFGDIEVNDMQAARYESGLDNSPMYDDDTLFDTTSHHMQLYDVGMTALYLTATLSLQSITDSTQIGTQYGDQLRRRYAEMAPLTSKLWNEPLGLYVNVRVNDSVPVVRLSPTSFFPMLALLPSVVQAERMMDHMVNTSEFCVSVECVGQPLPSISRSDVTYGDQQYWRGRQWGPHTLIVYWALSADKYAGSALIESVRKQLVVQTSALYELEWRQYHHVHENYDGDTGEGCNSGSSDPLYTWSATQRHTLLYSHTANIAFHRKCSAAALLFTVWFAAGPVHSVCVCLLL